MQFKVNLIENSLTFLSQVLYCSSFHQGILFILADIKFAVLLRRTFTPGNIVKFRINLRNDETLALRIN